MLCEIVQRGSGGIRSLILVALQGHLGLAFNHLSDCCSRRTLTFTNCRLWTEDFSGLTPLSALLSMPVSLWGLIFGFLFLAFLKNFLALFATSGVLGSGHCHAELLSNNSQSTSSNNSLSVVSGPSLLLWKPEVLADKTLSASICRLLPALPVSRPIWFRSLGRVRRYRNCHRRVSRLNALARVRSREATGGSEGFLFFYRIKK
jgi:hypothetical protein